MYSDTRLKVLSQCHRGESNATDDMGDRFTLICVDPQCHNPVQSILGFIGQIQFPGRTHIIQT
ncbi:MAG: hypothetical protein N0C84_14395, partial [Candidatus Thiodiazotropha taylori]|nr:hypothetical protein [Candidatus Thiodiazotropha taylori]MCW4257649.1 hypothetical protein [Candidatus Thiodiazotropha taylori]